MRKLAFVLAVAAAATIGRPAAQAAVELDLLLLVDVSGSVSAAEYALQKTGYVNAFLNSTVHDAIEAKADGIAVAYAEWSGIGQQSLLVGWTLLTDAASSNAFSAAINATSRAFAGNTALGDALDWGATQFGSPFGDADTKWVIDVSGDGARNEGSFSVDGRDAALLAGVDTINGLAILGEGGLQTHYQDNVIGGDNPSLFIATGFDTFEDAVVQKIGREIVDAPPGAAPEPTSLLVWGCLVAAGLGCSARRRPVVAC